jgi:hypothetical protein
MRNDDLIDLMQGGGVLGAHSIDRCKRISRERDSVDTTFSELGQRTFDDLPDGAPLVGAFCYWGGVWP